MQHGNPCAETNEAGIVGSGPGQKKDISCCMKKEKHDRCLQCSSMDCAHKTCNVNKKYYSTYTIVGKLDDKKVRVSIFNLDINTTSVWRHFFICGKALLGCKIGEIKVT